MPVLIPARHGDLDGLLRACERLAQAGRPFLADPILDPIHFGFTASIVRYHELRRRLPEVEMLMGVGNLTELTDADTTGITMTLMGMVSELAHPQHPGGPGQPALPARGREAELARRIMFAAKADGSLPQGYDPGLLALRDRRPFPNTPEGIAATAAEVADANLRIEIAADGIHVYNRDGHHVARDPFDLYPGLGVERTAVACVLSRRRARPGTDRAPARQALCPGQRAALGCGRAAASRGPAALRPGGQHPGGAPRTQATGRLMPFIRESIVTTTNADGSAYVAPLGVIEDGARLVIAPFHPSTTLANLRARPFACVNYTTDVRVFAGCVTRLRRDWPVVPRRGWARLAAGRRTRAQRGRGGGGARGRAAPTLRAAASCAR